MKLKLIKELSSLSSSPNKQDHQGSLTTQWARSPANIYYISRWDVSWENIWSYLFLPYPCLEVTWAECWIPVRRKLVKYLQIFPGLCPQAKLIFIREAINFWQYFSAFYMYNILLHQDGDSFVSFSYILLPLQSLCISQVLLENLSPFLSLPTSFSWIRKYLIKLFFNHLLKEYSNTQLFPEPDMSDCFLPSLLLHSSLSVQFELDCLARKHRGIASKLGATAGTNNTGIKISLGVEVVGLIWQ